MAAAVVLAVGLSIAIAGPAAATGWTIQATPSPFGAKVSTLNGVSCTPSGDCTAVGAANNVADGSGPLAERWNGTSWTIQATPNPAGARFSILNGVSCSAANACTAVGHYTTSPATEPSTELTLAERWDGKNWKIHATPTPPGAQSSRLLGVSCATANACTAVGYYFDGTDTVALAERWDGIKWTVQMAPNPPGAYFSILRGVSCTAADACAAIGSYFKATSTGTTSGLMAERWDGVSWTIQLMPSPTGATLYSVSCSDTNACTAVGQYRDATDRDITLAERWDGLSWTIQTTPNPTGPDHGVLRSVSCTAADACTAVGDATTDNNANQRAGGTPWALAERWDGASWKIEATPKPAGAKSSALNGVSCTGADACAAVGRDSTATDGSLTLAQRWDGASWKTQAIPTPVAAHPSFLSSVSCTQANVCTAVGHSINARGGAVPLAERRDGTSWMIQATPNPAAPTYDVPNGVSCTAANACTAVDDAVTAEAGFITRAERWDGTSWKIQATAALPGAEASWLYGVSCTGPKVCTAVGRYTRTLNPAPSNVPLGERWNGTGWKRQPTRTPPGAKSGYLYGVSCTAANACTAVGHYTNHSGKTLTLAERWNGRRWKLQATPNPARAKSSYLHGVSCTGAKACTAVGHYTNAAGKNLTLAERWNGRRWKLQATPNPAGAQSSRLNGVACTRAKGCTAVGYYRDATGVERPLAERRSAATHGIVTISDFKFVPKSITINLRETVLWTNNGPNHHTATADDGTFDTGLLLKGSTGIFRFTEAGTYRYHCTLHPFMRASVIVKRPGALRSSRPRPEDQAPQGRQPLRAQALAQGRDPAWRAILSPLRAVSSAG